MNKIPKELWTLIHDIEDEHYVVFDGDTYDEAKKFIEFWEPEIRVIRDEDCLGI